jgi:hypothetical protein
VNSEDTLLNSPSLSPRNSAKKLYGMGSKGSSSSMDISGLTASEHERFSTKREPRRLDNYLAPLHAERASANIAKLNAEMAAARKANGAEIRTSFVSGRGNDKFEYRPKGVEKALQNLTGRLGSLFKSWVGGGSKPTNAVMKSPVTYNGKDARLVLDQNDIRAYMNEPGAKPNVMAYLADRANSASGVKVESNGGSIKLTGDQAEALVVTRDVQVDFLKLAGRL